MRNDKIAKKNEENPLRVLFAGITVMFIMIVFGSVISAVPVPITSFNTNVDMNLNYLTEFELCDWVTLTMEKGVTDHNIVGIPAGSHEQDRRYVMLQLSVDPAPRSSKIVSVTISDGTNDMTVSVTGAETWDQITTGAFDLDVSAEALTLSYSQTGGGTTDHASIMMHYYFKENE